MKADAASYIIIQRPEGFGVLFLWHHSPLKCAGDVDLYRTCVGAEGKLFSAQSGGEVF